MTRLIRFLLLELLDLFRAGRRLLGGPAPGLGGPCCRFAPSCTEYARHALQRLPLARALALVVARLLRCQPFHPGGWDPVPAR